jgi:hypothetical protein
MGDAMTQKVGWPLFTLVSNKYGECALILQSGKLPKKRVEFRAHAGDSQTLGLHEYVRILEVFARQFNKPPIKKPEDAA